MDRLDNDKNYVEESQSDMEVSFEKRFGWYVVLNRIANGDITKHAKILPKTVIEIMNQLVYLVEYDREQARLQKKAMSQ
jgi:hypothetical protein